MSPLPQANVTQGYMPSACHASLLGNDSQIHKLDVQHCSHNKPSRCCTATRPPFSSCSAALQVLPKRGPTSNMSLSRHMYLQVMQWEAASQQFLQVSGSPACFGLQLKCRLSQKPHLWHGWHTDEEEHVQADKKTRLSGRGWLVSGAMSLEAACATIWLHRNRRC